jgi:plastocyanin domain-containing protein
VEVKVTSEGWVPDRIQARAGEPLTLVVTRTTEKTCATEIVVRDYGINARLPLGKPVTVTFTPKKAGEVRFACGMDMITGVIVVQ